MQKVFTKDYLIGKLGLPYDGAVEDRLLETNRWSEIHDLIFHDPEDGWFYRVRYSQGLTEYQDEQPWEYEAIVKGTRVELRPVTVKQWYPVEDSESA